MDLNIFSQSYNKGNKFLSWKIETIKTVSHQAGLKWS